MIQSLAKLKMISRRDYIVLWVHENLSSWENIEQQQQQDCKKNIEGNVGGYPYWHSLINIHNLTMIKMYINFKCNNLKLSTTKVTASHFETTCIHAEITLMIMLHLKWVTRDVEDFPEHYNFIWEDGIKSCKTHHGVSVGNSEPWKKYSTKLTLPHTLSKYACSSAGLSEAGLAAGAPTEPGFRMEAGDWTFIVLGVGTDVEVAGDAATTYCIKKRGELFSENVFFPSQVPIITLYLMGPSRTFWNPYCCHKWLFSVQLAQSVP